MIDQKTSFQDTVNYFKHKIKSFEPNMTFSIIGTAKNLKFDENKKYAFKLGLTKALQYFYRSRILIFTEGTDKGLEIANIVGDAINDDFHAAVHVKLIGVTTLESIQEDKFKYVNLKNQNSYNIRDYIHLT